MVSLIAEAERICIEGAICPSAGPLAFFRSRELKPLDVVTNGTFGLVDTGQKKLLVTCQHVWDGYLDFRLKNPNAILAALLGEVAIPISESQLIAEDRDCDLATFDVGPFLRAFSQMKFQQIRRFPVPRSKPGEVIVCVGYPGEDVGRKISEREARFDYISFIRMVTAVGAYQVLLAESPEHLHLVDNSGNEVPPVAYKGMSGSPCYKWSPNAAPKLKGFLKAGEQTGAPIYITHAAFLQPDGSVDDSLNAEELHWQQ